MYNIGMITIGFPEKEASTYIAEKGKEAFEVFAVDVDQLSNELENKDAIVIFTDNKDSVVTEICQSIIEIKRQSAAYVWVLSKNRDKRKRTIYLQLGADGNIDTDCSAKEIELIVLNALKRRETIHKPIEGKRVVTEEQAGSKEAEKQLFEMNDNNLAVRVGEKEISLTRCEYRLFRLLQSRAGEAFTYEEIYQSIWQQSYNNQKYRIANVIFRIREKLEQHAVNPNYLKTVRSVGYMICE
ncbi:response regulator transcription factor [Enterococcus sp. BWR-S5]|uniref:response regulator transcription factor n=1 Tax=Enterococcus sp. BWR-S5 TaxID=2787714 RepID=UPI001924E92E|nr:winged helix-turn-helix domain-containing protein [Enterococcus sp. BWR-S5]MBL1224043.1 response regulator transcription factor [Enterococcus sp. BWR-S5]